MRQKAYSFLILVAVLLAGGIGPLMAQVVAPYLVDFESPITTADSPLGQYTDGGRHFKVASGWGHVVDGMEYNMTTYRFTQYVYHSKEQGVDGSSCLFAGLQYGNDAYGDMGNWYDILVTPPVSGTVTLAVKGQNSTSHISFYRMTRDGDDYQRGAILKSVDGSQLSRTGYTVIALEDLDAGSLIGIHAQNVFIDNFTASSAEVSLQPSLKVVDVLPDTAQEADCDSVGNYSVAFTARVLNDGETTLTPGTAGYSLSLVNATTSETMLTVSVDETLAVGDTSQAITLSKTLNIGSHGGKYARPCRWHIQENINGTYAGGKTVTPIAYKPALLMKQAGTALATGQTLNLGTRHGEAPSLDCIIVNTGAAPLVIDSVGVTEGFATTLTAQTVAAHDTISLTISMSADAVGTKQGELTIATNDTDLTLRLTATLVPAETYFTDFETTESTEGMMLEAAAPTSSSTYGWRAPYQAYNDQGHYAYGYTTASNAGPYKLILPKLRIEEGEALTFDAARNSDYSHASLTIYYSADRSSWTELRSLSSDAGQEADLLTLDGSQFLLTGIPAGEWYIGFEVSGESDVRLDNLFGGEKVAVAHDLMLTVQHIDESGSVNNRLTVRATAHNLSKAEAADSYSARLYFDDELMKEAEPVALPTATDVVLDFSFTPHAAGTYQARVEIVFADGEKVATPPQQVVIAEETYAAQVQAGGEPTGSSSYAPVNTDNGQGESQTIYTPADLPGLTAGTAITRLTVKGFNQGAESAYPTQVLLGETELTAYKTDEENGSSWPQKYLPVAAEALTHVFDGTITLAQGGSQTEPIDVVEISFAQPYTYQGKSLVLHVRNDYGSGYNMDARFLTARVDSVQSIYRSSYSGSFDHASYEQLEGYTACLPVVFFGIEAEARTISGKVVDADTQEPMAGVTVRATSGDVLYTDTTSEEGHYEMSIKQAMLTYTVAAQAPGYRQATATVEMNGESQTLDFALTNLKKDIVEEIDRARHLLGDAGNLDGRDELTAAIAAAQAVADSEEPISEAEAAACVAQLRLAEEAFVEANTLQDGRYYVRNKATWKFWGAGSAWGTQATLVDEYQYVMLKRMAEGTYTMETMVSNGGTSHYFDGDFMDGQPVQLAIKRQASGYYTIATDGECYGYDGQGTVLGKQIAADSDSALWQLMTETEVLAEQQAMLATATAEAPVDATFLIKDAGFGRNRRDAGQAWTFESDNKTLGGPGDQDLDNYCAESYHATFSLSQTIVNAPRGIYCLNAQGFYRQDGSDNGHLPCFLLNDEQTPFQRNTGGEDSMAESCASFSNGLYRSEPLYVQIGKGDTIIVGARLEENTDLWCCWDNFQLTYYGPDADLNSLKLEAALKRLDDLHAELRRLRGVVEVDAVLMALNEALEAALNAEWKMTEEAIGTAIDMLTVAIDLGQASEMAKNILPKMRLLTKSTNIYTEEALDAYYGQWQAKYDEGTLTKAEAMRLEDPYAVTGWRASNTVDDLLMSAWDAEPMQWDTYHVNTWSVEGQRDGTQFEVPFMEYWTGDAESLAEKTLTATLTGVEAGDYDVEAWVRVRTKNEAGADVPATGITMQVCDGESVSVTSGEQTVALNANNHFVLGHYKAKGTVGADGVLSVKFLVAADNNISWLSFRDVTYTVNTEKIDAARAQLATAIAAAMTVSTAGKTADSKQALAAALAAAQAAAATPGSSPDELTAAAEALDDAVAGLTDYADDRHHQWNFSKWSAETVGNLKADAAADETKGWSDVEPAEAAKDRCFWAVTTPDADGNLTANGTVIAELEGLTFDADYAAARLLAIAVSYPQALGDYQGPAYLWLGGKQKDCFTIKNVKAGTTIVMGVESHKAGEARGVQLFVSDHGARGQQLKAADGSDAGVPTTYAEQSWTLPAEAGVSDIIVSNTNGCHIYFIDAEISEAPSGMRPVAADAPHGILYDLKGQRARQTVKKGLYIVNGRKVVAKNAKK